ncbi:MAG: nitrogen regulation protein NR(II) [Gammaproteobacteria bacterium]|nr:nitrogen regulation protein NR(II) [Gammaproteobacteria bacterium]MCP5136126.1 nitrogen regulation protein NR(II) [Gammaproteobacteria bacterium]
MDAQTTSSIAALVVENQSAAVLLFNGKLQLTYLNPAAEALLGISERHAVGLTVDVIFADMSEAEDCMTRSLTQDQPFAERELEMHRADGSAITVDCTVTPLIDGDGPRSLLVELVQVDRHLRINREEALLAQEKVSRALVRGMAHEIKNPLGGLRGAAQLLQKELADPNLHEYTQVIIAEADRLQTLVNRMLGPRSEPRFAAVNIFEVLEHVIKLVAAETGERVQVFRDYDPSIPELSADRGMLIQAVLNLVRNAIEALGLGGGNITFRTRAQRQFTIGTRRHRLVIRVDVIDTGPGIDPEFKDRIFYPMVTSRAEGTGLGLSIAQSLINRHQGLIECDSEPGNTVFSIYLPMEISDD